MAAPLNDALVLSGASLGSIAPSSTVAATTAGLATRIYEVWTTKECWIKVGSTAVTTSNGYNLSTSARPRVVFVNQTLSAICTAAASGVLFYHRVG